MTTTFMKGDLFQDGADEKRAHAFAFAADVSVSMGQGIAVAFAKRWPAFAEAFRAANLQAGDVFAWTPDKNVWIYALGLSSGDKKPKVSVLIRALDAMVERATADGVHRIAMPKVGGGKGGIDPLRVKAVLTEAGSRTTISLVVFEQFVRAKPAADKPEA